MSETTTSRTQEALLLEFLREHDAACPVCGYNLRALTRPTCPECRQDLVLTVGVTRLRLGWLLATLAPGFFSGIAAFFVLLLIGGGLLFGGYLSPGLVVLDLFGWSSGLAAIILARKRSRFLALPLPQQQVWAVVVWGVHFAAFVLLILLGPMYL